MQSQLSEGGLQPLAIAVYIEHIDIKPALGGDFCACKGARRVLPLAVGHPSPTRGAYLEG